MTFEEIKREYGNVEIYFVDIHKGCFVYHMLLKDGNNLFVLYKKDEVIGGVTGAETINKIKAIPYEISLNIETIYEREE